MCCDYTGLSKWANEWQTLIAGLLVIVGALAGGAWAYYGARNAAHRQIQALQKQNNELRRAEQRRLARESSTVAGVLYAAMGLVAGDIGKALAAIPKVISASFRDRPPPDDPPLDAQIANYIRHMVRKHGFDYLRDRVGTFNRKTSPLPLWFWKQRSTCCGQSNAHSRPANLGSRSRTCTKRSRTYGRLQRRSWREPGPYFRGTNHRRSADSGGSRPRIRDDVARHSDLISLGVPR